MVNVGETRILDSVHPSPSLSHTFSPTALIASKMSDTGSKPGPEPSERTAIGITFGNSNSSIAYVVDDKAEVIANEDGGENRPCCGLALV